METMTTRLIHVGTSGWSYDHWEDVPYPAGLPAAKRLAYYVANFDTVELNASFYRWPRPASFASWHRQLPPGFLMSAGPGGSRPAGMNSGTGARCSWFRQTRATARDRPSVKVFPKRAATR